MNSLLRRRQFLTACGGAGMATALAPFFPLMEARGQNAGFPRRLVIFFTPNGMTSAYPKPFAPVGGETDFVFPSGSILEPLSAYRDKLIILQGIDMRSSVDSPGIGGHPRAMLNMLTGTPGLPGNQFDGGGRETGGWAGGPSVDQFLGKMIGADTPFPALVLGVAVKGEASPFTRITFSAADLPVPPENSPYNVLNRVFASGMGQDPLLYEKLRAEQRSVLDTVKQDLGDLYSRLGSAGKQKLDAHLTALRGVETRLQTPPPVLGPTCKPPTAGTLVDPLNEDNTPVLGDLQLRLAVAALACGQTKVVTVQWGKAPNGNRMSWLNPALPDSWHVLSHMAPSDAAANGQLVRAARWFATQFKTLLDLLKAVPEGNGTLLDNTTVLWCTENSRSDSHDWRNMPYVLAGGMGGAFKTGRFLNYNGLPHNRLLTSLCHGMGVPSLSTFGSDKYGTGPLPGLAG